MSAAHQIIAMPAWIDVAPTIADLRKLMERKVMSLHHLRRTNAELEAILAVDASDVDLREALAENRPVERQFTRQLTKLANIVEQLEVASKAGLAVAFVVDDEEEDDDAEAITAPAAAAPTLGGAAASTPASAGSAAAATPAPGTGAGASAGGGLPAASGVAGTVAAAAGSAAPAATDSRPAASGAPDGGDNDNAGGGMYL